MYIIAYKPFVAFLPPSPSSPFQLFILSADFMAEISHRNLLIFGRRSYSNYKTCTKTFVQTELCSNNWLHFKNIAKIVYIQIQIQRLTIGKVRQKCNTDTIVVDKKTCSLVVNVDWSCHTYDINRMLLVCNFSFIHTYSVVREHLTMICAFVGMCVCACLPMLYGDNDTTKPISTRA